MSLDLNKLANKLDEALSNETTETLNKFLNDKRMSNNKKSSVEWFAKESWKLRVALEDGKISVGEYANKYYQMKEQAKAMHKEEIMQALNDGKAMVLGSIENKSLEQYYNETFKSE